MKLTLGGCTSPSEGSDTRWSCGVETVGAVSTDGPVVSYGSATAGVRAGLSRADNRLKNEWSRRESNPRPLECHSSALPTELRPHRREQPSGKAHIARCS